MDFNFASYSSETFDNLPSLNHAFEAFNEANGLEAVKEFKDIFWQHNQQNNFSLILLHRHFHQEPTEITVEILSESKSISTPWHLSDKIVPDELTLNYLKTNDWDLKQSIGKYVRPHSWKFNANGTLSPYEFVSTNLDEVPIPQDFAAAIYAKLKSMKLDTVLGLHWNHRNNGKVCLETSHATLRANILDIKENFTEEDARDTMNVIWGFWDKSAKTVLVCRCYKIQSGHTGIHT